MFNAKELGRAYEHVQRPLTPQERTALRESLATHGLRDAIVVDQHNDILDGYNREDLCRELGIPPEYLVMTVDDPVHWIRHNQTARRNLTETEMRELIVKTKAANPEASTRSIAEQLGANPRTVARALEKSGVTPVTPVKGKDGKTYKPKLKPTPGLEKALHAYDRRKLAGEPITIDAITEEIGTSVTPARRAITIRTAEENAEKQAEIILSTGAQERFEAKLRAHKKQLDLAFETAVFNEVRRRNKEIGLRFYQEKLDEVEKLLNSPRWAVMPITEFKMILACLHPDNARPGHEDRFSVAFSLFNKYKLKMVDLSAEKEEKDRLKRIELRGAPLPRTVEEMLARKRTKR